MNASFQKDEYLKLLEEFKTFTTEKDGPITPDRWNSISPKAVFLAMETYGFLGCEQCPVMDSPNGWSASRFNQKIAKIAYGIDNFIRTGQKIDSFHRYKVIPNNLREAYESIALIEIKKTSTDAKTKRCSYASIRSHSKRNAAFLTRQLNHLLPDIIFCCGLVTYHSLIYI